MFEFEREPEDAFDPNDINFEADVEVMDQITKFKWDADLKAVMAEVSPRQVIFFVKAYYMLQLNRTRAKNQLDRLTEHKDPSHLIDWLFRSSKYLEDQIFLALSEYAFNHPVGVWSMCNYGIGPVLTAGLLAYIRMDEKTKTCGQTLRLCGHNPNDKWLGAVGAEKLLAEIAGRRAATEEAQYVALALRLGRKPEWVREKLHGKNRVDQVKFLSLRPWNADFKTLAWKIGQCLFKFSKRPACYYGHFYQERKAYEQAKNGAGDYKGEAERKLRECPTHKQASIYKRGILSDGHIHSRACKWAAKQFIIAFWEVLYRYNFPDRQVPVPYVEAHLGHVHMRPPYQLDIYYQAKALIDSGKSARHLVAEAKRKAVGTTEVVDTDDADDVPVEDSGESQEEAS